MRRALIIDDDEQDRRAAELALRAADPSLTFVLASTLAEAVEAGKSAPIDLVFVDIALGDVPGEDVMAALRSAEIHAPIFLLTSTTDPERVAAGMRAGAIDYFAKGTLDPDRLRATLRSVGRIARAEAEAERARTVEERHRRQLEQLVEASVGLTGARSFGEIAERISAAAELLFGARARGEVSRDGVVVAAHPAEPLPSAERFASAASASGLSGALEVARATPLDESERLLARQLKRAAVTSAELLVLVHEADERARERQEIVAIVSHDLRTPLQTFAMGLDAVQLMVGDAAGDKIAPICARMKRSIQSMTRLLGDLLDVSRIHDSVLSVRLAPTRLGPVFDEIREQLAAHAEQKGLGLEMRVEPELALTCDPGRLHQAIANLVSNALTHTDAGRVAVVARREGGHVRIEVADTGPGIPPEVRGRLFERLYQGERGGRSGGLGLGLFIVKGIVEAHGGVVGVDSEVGRGSTFWIELPATPEGALVRG